MTDDKRLALLIAMKQLRGKNFSLEDDAELAKLIKAKG